MKKPKIFIACDTTDVNKVRQILKESKILVKKLKKKNRKTPLESQVNKP